MSSGSEKQFERVICLCQLWTMPTTEIRKGRQSTGDRGHTAPVASESSFHRWFLVCVS